MGPHGRGAGLSTINIAVLVGVYRDVPPSALPSALPSASSLTRILQQLGGAFGAAILAMILARSLHAVPTLHAVRAYGRTMWWSIGFLGLILIPALWLPGRPRSQ